MKNLITKRNMFLAAPLLFISKAQANSRTLLESEFALIPRFERNNTLERSILEKALSLRVFNTPSTCFVIDLASQKGGLLIFEENQMITSLGLIPISSGRAGPRDYFYTPPGVFDHDGKILGWRAQGTPNSHGIRGFGVRGLRIWDFGWQDTDKGDGLKSSQIRFLMHGTDPDYLESKLGTKQSKGCIRVSTQANRFLDKFGILDKVTRDLAQDDKRWRALLGTYYDNNYTGRYLIVV